MAPDSNPGRPDARLEPKPTNWTLNIRAIDHYGELDPSYNGTVDIYVHYQGSRTTPSFGRAPLSKVELVDGVAEGVEVLVPKVFGPAVLWVEDMLGDAGQLLGRRLRDSLDPRPGVGRRFCSVIRRRPGCV